MFVEDAGPGDPFADVRIHGVPIMPSNGVLLLESEGFEVLVSLTDADGEVIEALARTVSALPNGNVLAWKPEHELVPGTYTATLGNAFDSPSPSVEIQVVPAFPAALPPISSAPSTSVVATNTTLECCGTPLPAPINQACFSTAEAVVAEVQPGLSSSAPMAWTNQYLFRLRVVGAVDAAHPWVTFEQVSGASFAESKDQYCLILEAQNLANEEIEAYEETLCAPGVDRALGDFDLEVEDIALARNVCLVPPLGYEQRWCSLNQHACDRKPSDDCEQYDYNCRGGRWPSAWAELGFDDPNASSDDAASSSGCAASRGAPARPFALGMAVMALVLTRRRGLAGAGRRRA